MAKQVPAEESSEHEFLLQDITKAQGRAKGATYLEAKQEFADNCYPLLQAIAEHFGERMDQQEAALDALINESESFLHPELAQQIGATLELGRALADAVLKTTPPVDEVALKRLQQTSAAYLTAAEMTIEAVASVSPPPDEEEVEDDDDEDETGEEE